MKKEDILKRKTELTEQFEQIKAQMEQLKATANAFSGAIQDCEFWLDAIDKADKPVLVPDAPPQDSDK